MSGQCSICLGEYDEPVCIPCGHVYCVGCITDVVNRPDEAVTARCPTCRTEFHLVVPDLTYLPKKYHPFVISPLRRIYLPAPTPASPSPSTSSLLKAEEQSRAALSQLEAEVAKYKSRVATYRETEEMLMQQCERHQAKAHAYREREWEARKEVRRLGKEARDVGERVMELEGSLERVIDGGRRAEERAGRLEGEVGRLRKENEALELKLRLMNIQGGTPKRTSTPHPGGPDPSSDEALDPSSSISTNNSSININVNIGTSTYATTLHHTTPSYGYSESISAPIPSGSTSPRRVTRPLPRSRLSIGPSTVSNTKVSSTKKTAHKKAGVHAASLPMSMTTPLGFPMDLGSTKKARLVGAAQSEQNGRNGQTEVDKTTLANRVSNSNLNANAKVFSLRGALDDGAAAARRKTIDGEAFYEAVSSGSGASRHVSGQGHVPRKKSVSHMRSVSVGVMDE